MILNKKDGYNTENLETHWDSARPRKFTVSEAVDRIDESSGIESRISFLYTLVADILAELPEDKVLKILNSRAWGGDFVKG